MRYVRFTLILLLSVGCSSMTGPTVDNAQPAAAGAKEEVSLASTQDLDPRPWHFLVCPRQTESQQIEFHVGRSGSDYAVLTWKQGEPTAIPVPAPYAGESALWVRVRVFDRRIANVCLRSEDTNRKNLVTDREVTASVANTDTNTCPCP